MITCIVLLELTNSTYNLFCYTSNINHWNVFTIYFEIKYFFLLNSFNEKKIIIRETSISI